MTPSIFQRLQIPAVLALFAVTAHASVSNYCTGAPNSVGPGADIAWVGPHNPQFGGLTVQGCPSNSFGVFLYSMTPAQTPFGDGFACVGAPMLNLARRRTDAAGSLLMRVWWGSEQEDLQWLTHPQNIGVTWHFQYMYRDVAGPGGTGFNLSDGVAVQFSPFE